MFHFSSGRSSAAAGPPPASASSARSFRLLVTGMVASTMIRICEASEIQILHQCQDILQKIFINNTFVIITRDGFVCRRKSCVRTDGSTSSALHRFSEKRSEERRVKNFSISTICRPFCLLRFAVASAGCGMTTYEWSVDETSFLFNHLETYIVEL